MPAPAPFLLALAALLAQPRRMMVVGSSSSPGCPVGTEAVNEPWTPIAWRDPAPACACPASAPYCRGPYCYERLGHRGDDAPAHVERRGFLAACGGSCRCLPRCADKLDCWSDACVCDHTLQETIGPRDATLPHTPRTVREALAVSFNTGIPGELDVRYKNPCWHKGGRDSDDLRCLPYVYIPGILKCATSALYDVLAKHPMIEVSYPKETHWWTRARQPFKADGGSLQDTGWLVRHARRILRETRAGRPAPIVLEGSASMFWDQPIGGVMVPELLHEVTPNARFVLMVRDPADRLYSDYRYFSYRTLHGKDPHTQKYSYDAHGFHLAVQQSLVEIRRCQREHSNMTCAWEQRRYDPRTQIQLGMYSEYVETWQSFFPPDQFLVICQEDIKTAPRPTFDRITTFLGIPPLTDKVLFPDGKGEMKQSNSGGKYKQMLPETRALLDEFYAPFNEKLAFMLNDERFRFHIHGDA